jgi:hypothetical protein
MGAVLKQQPTVAGLHRVEVDEHEKVYRVDVSRS